MSCWSFVLWLVLRELNLNHSFQFDRRCFQRCPSRTQNLQVLWVPAILFLVFGFSICSSTSSMLAFVLLDLMHHFSCCDLLILSRPFLSFLLHLLPKTYSQTICSVFGLSVVLYQHPITMCIFYICHENSLT